MFDALLTDFEEQMTLFETETLAEFSHLQVDTFVDLNELESVAESEYEIEDDTVPMIELNERQFVSLDYGGFVELDRRLD